MPSAALKIAASLPLAVAHLGAKTPVVSALRSAAWAKLPLALRERAQFSAGVEKIRVMAAIQDLTFKRTAMLREQVAHGTAGVNLGSFIGDMKKVIRGEGLPMGGEGLTDISSAERLKLIYDFQTQSAASYARWMMGQDQVALDFYPAQEFLRVESRIIPRYWPSRWDEAFSPFAGATRAQSGRMVALMNHPGWTNLSVFGTPWPPFDYGSGMGVESVDRADAMALGLLGPDDRVTSAEADFNDKLEASVKDLSPEWRAKLQDAFGDQVVIAGDKAAWQGNLIGDLVDRVEAFGLDRPFDNKIFKGQKIDLGQATPQATAMAEPYLDISRMRMQLLPENIYHMLNEHGKDAETRGDQRAVTKLDIEILPHVWRDPDKIERGNKPRSLALWKTLLGKTRMVEWNQYPDSDVMMPVSMLVKKEAG